MKTQRYVHPLFTTGFFIGTLFLLVQVQVFTQRPEVEKIRDVVETVSQPDSPIVITPVSIDTSHETLVTVKFTAQNLSHKNIQAYTISRNIRGESPLRGMQTCISPLNAGQSAEGWESEAKVNLEQGSKLYFLVDYVLFADGTTWGRNLRNESELIAGLYKGRDKAISEIKSFLDKADEASLSKLLQQESIQVDIDKKQSVRWQAGYEVGYKIVLAELTPIYRNQGMESLPSNIQEFNNLIKPVTVSH